MIVGSNILAGASGQAGYFLNRSVRLRSSATAYFNRTFASAGNRKTWTWSGWVKRGVLASFHGLMSAGTSNNDWTGFRFNNDDTFAFYRVGPGGGTVFLLNTTQVFRDPSAWYHIVLQWDTTQATASNRIKLYVNGVQVTAFSTSNYPTLNYDDPFMNTAVPHLLGNITGALLWYDGYLTEINFIDGQALTPTSFGEFNTLTGVWQPKKYGGTYGTNGFYLPFNLQNTSSYAGSFNGSSQYLTLNGQSAFTLGNNSFTIETWIYPTSASQTSIIYDGRPSGTQGIYPALYLNAGAISYFVNNANLINGTSPSINQWHHVAVVRNGTTTTLYLDGVSQGSATDTNNYLSGGTGRPAIGVSGVIPANYFNGLLSNLRVVNGSAVYTSNFVPSSTPLTAITNTALLTLQNATIIDNSTNAFTITNSGSVVTALAVPFVANIGADGSGNNNNWYANNINVATLGTTFDSMTDVPTLTSVTQANYAVMNPLDKGSNVTIANGNLGLTLGGAGSIRSTFGVSTGKWYWEATLISTAVNASQVGVGTSQATLTSFVGSDAFGWAWHGLGQIYNSNAATNGVSGNYTVGFTTNDIISVILDCDAGTLTFWKNGSTLGTAVSSGLSGNVLFPISGELSGTNVWAYNFGQRPFTYTPPTNFKALNTYNLPTPTISNGATQMAASLYTGNGIAAPNALSVTNTVNGISFKPDFVWIKSRSLAQSNILQDAVRGLSVFVESNTITADQATGGGDVSSFNSNGFTISYGNGRTNQNGATYVGWQWKASNAAAVTNTSGTISSQVSANTTAGFSIVTWTAPSGAIAYTVGHGLGVAPSLILMKDRSTNAAWIVYHRSVCTTTALYLVLNSTVNLSTAAGIWGSALPTSTVFGNTAGTGVNGGSAVVAYCFSEISGYSKFGSYTGNANADGVFVYTGFRPRYILIKSSSLTGTGWYIYDTSRNTYNVMDLYVRADDPGIQASFVTLDALSNGFKIRTNNSQFNGSATTYIYFAFAENPFKNALAR